MDKESIIKIRLFVKKLKKDFSVERVIFFGSRTGKEYLEHSDIDLIIVSKNFEGMDFSKRISKMYDYWNFEDFPYGIDFFCYTPEEFTKLSKMIGVVSEALKKGIVM